MHLLNNYLFNYLNFLGLTFPPTYKIFVLENWTYLEIDVDKTILLPTYDASSHTKPRMVLSQCWSDSCGCT